MSTDIVIPRGNEKEFIRIAKVLGYSQIIFAYPLGQELPKIKDDDIKVRYARIISKKEMNKAQAIREIVIAEAGSENRLFFESRNIDMIYGLEKTPKKDYIHHRASGMNQVMAKLAEKNRISIAFSFSMMLGRKAEVLARISQNIRICRKYGLDMVCASFAREPYQMRSPKDIISLMKSLGMEGGEAKKSLEKFK